MICPYCKKEICDNSDFCEFCGQPIVVEGGHDTELANYWKSVESENVIRKKEKIEAGNRVFEQKNKICRNKIFLLIGGIFLTAFVSCCIWRVSIKQNVLKSEPDKSSVLQEISVVMKDKDSVDTTKKDISSGSSVIEDGFAESEEKSVGTYSEYILATSDSQYLKKSDLEGMTAEECRLARNEIYARHGRRFKDEQLQNYFDACSWYQGTVDPDDFQESILNDFEIKNIETISGYEREMGFWHENQADQLEKNIIARSERDVDSDASDLEFNIKMLENITVVPYSWSSREGESFHKTTGSNRLRSWNNEVYGGLVKLNPNETYKIIVESSKDMDFYMGYILFETEDGTDGVEENTTNNSGWNLITNDKGYYEIIVRTDENNCYLGMNFANKNKDELSSEEVDILKEVISNIRLEISN